MNNILKLDSVICLLASFTLDDFPKIARIHWSLQASLHFLQNQVNFVIVFFIPVENF